MHGEVDAGGGVGDGDRATGGLRFSRGVVASSGVGGPHHGAVVV